MNITTYQEAFGAADVTSRKMRQALQQWQTLYYRSAVTDGEDPCQRIAYTIVNKLVRTTFAEYSAHAVDPFAASVVQALDKQKEQAIQLALVEGECYLKPWLRDGSFDFTVIPRSNALIFARDPAGCPTDIGTVEKSSFGNAYYTLLERRTANPDGTMTIRNRLFKSYDSAMLGQPVALSSHPDYRLLAEVCSYPAQVGVGLVQLRTPMLNCVDGSADGVSVFAAAAGLIHAIDRNEYLLSGEFERGQSRVFTSSDLLDENKGLSQNLFVGLDEDVERVGITVFSPQLREQSFLNRKQEYLRNVESVIGLKRGLLSDANVEERTATEIASSQGEHALTVLDFQRMWERAVTQCVVMCARLGKLFHIPGAKEDAVSIDWGNGVLHDESAIWEDYKDMVAKGMISPEVALGWRFGMPAQSQADRAAIRARFMPK